MRGGAATTAVSLDRYYLMRPPQQQARPVNSALVPVNASPVLPALPGANPANPVMPLSYSLPDTPAPAPFQLAPPPAKLDH